MNKLASSVLLLTLCAAGVTVASDLDVTLTPHGTLKIPTERVFRLVCDTGNEILALELGADGRISLPDDVRSLECRVDEEDIWSQSTEAAFIGDPTTISIAVWPAAEFRGRIAGPDPLDGIPMSISVARADGEGVEYPSVRECTIDAERLFRCPVPATRSLDAKIRLTGYISHFFWGVDTTGDIDLGERQFRPGASVIGRVELHGQCNDPQTQIIVRLTPLLSGGTSSSQESRLERQIASAKTGKQGFFHFDGVEAGKYSVSAEQEGCGKGQMSPVTVNPRAETRLREPLVLTPPSDLEVLVNPSLDPWGGVWKIKLVHITPLSGAGMLLGERWASEAGVVKFSNLSRGPYEVSVVDIRESSWALQPVNVETALERIEINLDLVEVTGTVLSGNDEVEAYVIFGGKHGIPSIRTVSDEEGRFDAVLPGKREWTVDIVGINTPIKRTLPEIEVYDGADVTLRVGDRVLAGRVVDEEGRPFSGAGVHAYKIDEPGFFSQTISGEDGAFRFGGFERGVVVLNASLDSLSADEEEYDLTAEDANDIELVLKDRGLFILNVTRGGLPAPGAIAQHIRPQTTGIACTANGADLNGRIEVPLQPGETKGVVVVIAQGAPVQLISLDRHQSPLIVGVDGRGGTLSIPMPVDAYSSLRVDGGLFPLPFFYDWANIMQVQREGNLLTIGPMAAGYYEACTGTGAEAECSSATLQEGVAITLD